jgi:hypothetical protein
MNASKLSVNNTPVINGTAGRIFFQGSTNVLQQSANLFWDNTNGRLGIGTSTPTSAMQIVGSTNLEGLLNITNNTTLNFANAVNILFPNTVNGNQVAGFYIGKALSSKNGWGVSYTHSSDGSNSNRGSIDFFGVNSILNWFASGNVAINTTTDAGYKLDVNGTARFTGATTIQTLTVGLGTGSQSNNTVLGLDAFTSNTSGNFNVAIGPRALNGNTTGTGNIGIGHFAAVQISNGTNNVAIGREALSNGNSSGNVVVGMQACNTTTGNNNVVLGLQAQAGNFSNSIVIGNSAIGAGNNSVVLGNDSITTTVLKGNVGIGTSSPVSKLHVSGSIPVVSNLAQGVLFNNTITATSASDILVGLDINPTFGGNNSSNWHTLRLWQPLDQYGDNRPYLSWRYGNSGGSQFDVFRMFMDAGWKVNFKSTGAQPGFIFTGGNLMINTTTDAGFRLDVNGTAIVRGVLNVGTALTGLSFSGADCAIFNNGGSGGAISLSMAGNTYFRVFQPINAGSGITSGTINTITTPIAYAWASGTASPNLFQLNPNYNFTGTYSGIVRGFYYNPSLSSMTGVTHYAIHSTSGRVRLEGLPTSPTGLSAGDLYNDAGTLRIV